MDIQFQGVAPSQLSNSHRTGLHTFCAGDGSGIPCYLHAPRVLGQQGVATARTRQQRPAKASVESSARLHVRGSSSPHMNISAASSEMSARNAVTRACACSMGASARDAVVTHEIRRALRTGMWPTQPSDSRDALPARALRHSTINSSLCTGRYVHV